MGRVSTEIKRWWAKSPRRAIPVLHLYAIFTEETNIKCSYQYFKKITDKITKVQSIKTGGFYTRLTDVANVITARAIMHVNASNTYCIDEKPFIPKKFSAKWLRVSKTFIGKATAKEVKCQNPLKDISPLYLICAINSKKVVLYSILDEPLNKATFNAFLWKLISYIPNKGKRQYILFDNASFHGIEDLVKEKLDVNGLAITRTPPLGCFMDPIEEFFGHVHQEFKFFLSRRVAEYDEPISKTEFKMLIHTAVQCANAECNFEVLYNRAGLF